MADAAKLFRLRSDLSIGFQSCGRVNAYFDKQHQAIVFCTELIELIISTVKADNNLTQHFSPAQLNFWIAGVIWGIYFHEFTHALIDINRVKIVGREEDVADQFSVWFAVNYVNLAQQPIVTPVVWFWRAMSTQRGIFGRDEKQLQVMLSDEHSLDDQRTYNIACWAYGKNPEKGAGLVKLVSLSEARAVRCPSEYGKMNDGMRNIFMKYIKVHQIQ